LAEVRVIGVVDQMEVGEGAYVNLIIPERSKQAAECYARADLLEAGFEVKSFENTQLWEERIAESEVASELHDLATEARRSDTVQYGTFHLWDKENGGP
jgi:hypothetical protein